MERGLIRFIDEPARTNVAYSYYSNLISGPVRDHRWLSFKSLVLVGRSSLKYLDNMYQFSLVEWLTYPKQYHNPAS